MNPLWLWNPLVLAPVLIKAHAVPDGPLRLMDPGDSQHLPPSPIAAGTIYPRAKVRDHFGGTTDILEADPLTVRAAASCVLSAS